MGLALAVAAGVWLALDPHVYHGVSAAVLASGQVTTARTSASLIEENGAWVIGLLCIPVALAALCLFCALRQRRVLLWVGGLTLIGFVVVSGFTIGMFYAPAALAELVASGLSRGPAAPPQ